MKQFRTLISLTAVSAMLLMLAGCSYRIYSVSDRPRLGAGGGILYALPRTQVVADITLVSYDRTAALYSQYAAEMVGGDSADLYRPAVSLSSRNVPDPKAYYYVVPRRISVDVDKNHLLHSVGIPSSDFSSLAQPQSKAAVPALYETHLEYNLYPRTDTFYVKGDKPGHPSHVSAKPDARSLRQRALSAADELRSVQERLRSLENGDFDDSYSIEQVQYVQQRLQQRQADLLRLFVGEPQVQTFSYTYVPRDEYKLIDSQSVVLFYYSPLSGIADSGAAGAVPVVLDIRCDNHTRNAARFVKFRTDGRDGHTAKQRRCFKYRMAEQAEVTLSCPYFTAKAQLPVVQFGPTVDLPKRRFEALFDPQTGDLLYYNGRP